MSLLECCIVALPLTIWLMGPDDAVVWSIIGQRALRTWHVETGVLMLMLGAVVVATGDSWMGWACWILAHSARSIGARAMEALMRMRGGRQWLESHVECMRWGAGQQWLALSAGAGYMALHRSYVGLAGMLCDVLYRQWRWWRTRHERYLARAIDAAYPHGVPRDADTCDADTDTVHS